MYTILKLLGKTLQHFILLCKKGTCRAHRFLRKHSDDEQFFRRANPFGGQGTNQQAHVNSNFTKKRKEKLSN